MSPETKKQIYELMKNSTNPLILIPGRSNLDAASAALSLFLMFKKINKEPQIVSLAPLVDKFLFLPEIKSVSYDISSEAVYKVTVNVAKSDLKQVSYDQENDLLNIYLTVKKGKIKIDSVALSGAKFKHDLVIVLAIPNFNSLGKIYFENEEMFLKVPIINIDYNAANERFGVVNLIEAAPAEMAPDVTEIIKGMLPSGIDEKMATLLLASIISSTDNFQAAKINSGIFSLAAELIKSGAKREEIISQLYRFKNSANLNAVIADRATANNADDILKKKSNMESGGINR